MPEGAVGEAEEENEGARLKKNANDIKTILEIKGIFP